MGIEDCLTALQQPGLLNVFTTLTSHHLLRCFGAGVF